MRLIATVIAITALLRADGQTPIRFDGTTNRWYVADSHPQGNIDNPNFIATTTLHYFLNGDSLVGVDSWGKIFAQDTTGTPTTPTLNGLVRQPGDVVLHLDVQGILDTLYDFRLQVGDSFRYVSDFYDTYLPVVQVDSILILGAHHKIIRFGEYVLSLEEALSDTWIEGIGSIHGPLAPRMPNTLGINYGIPDSTRTTCFLQGEQTLWTHPSYPECIVNVRLGMNDLDGSSLTILHPNPGTTFQLTGIGHRPALLRLLDMQGRTVRAGITATEHVPVDVGDLKPGTYVVQVWLANGQREVVRWVNE